MDIKPIQTSYSGYRFRSRLEARWAVFFDALGLAWEYESEGFELPPIVFDKQDFIRRHTIEAKASGVSGLLDPLAEKFVSLSERTLYYLPDFWLPDGGVWAEVKGKGMLSLEDITKMIRLTHCTQRPIVYCCELNGEIRGMEAADKPDRVRNLTFTFAKGSQEIEAAFFAARSARFEHGEQPRVR